MNYELAKELKCAGFPQKSRMGSILTKNDAPPQTEDDYAYPPTLSELIEGCGTHFYELLKQKKPNRWYAGTDLKNPAILPRSGTGSTPEEAAARLWLALNKN